MKDFSKFIVASFLFLAFGVLVFGCAEQSETHQEANPAQAVLKAKIVYYAIPG